jgi:ABC-type nitrate/sulfonate/bicarbonate transport system permease component
MMPVARGFGRLVQLMALPAVLLVLWAWVSSDSEDVFYPPLTSILEAFRETWISSRIQSDVLPSLIRMLLGFMLAAAVAVPLGLLLGRVHVLERALQPLLHFARSLPGPALVPVFLSLMGYGDGMKVALIAFVCSFPILLNCIDGVRSVEPRLMDVVRMFGIGRVDRTLRVLVPAASPQIFAGLRVALQLAFIMMVVSEMVAATNGIGYQTLIAQKTFSIPSMWAGMLLLGILGYATNAVFGVIERRVLAWHASAFAATSRR